MNTRTSDRTEQKIKAGVWKEEKKEKVFETFGKIQKRRFFRLSLLDPIYFFVLPRNKKSSPTPNSTYYLNKGGFLCPICGKNYSCPSALDVSQPSIL